MTTDPPATEYGGRRDQSRIVEATAASQHQAEHVGGFGRELQSARRYEVQLAFELADDAGQIGMAKPFLHRQQRILPSLHQHQATWIEPGTSQASSEQILLAQDPEDRSGTTSKQTGSK